MTRKRILDLDRDLRYPEQSFDEIQRNRGIMQERSGLSATTIDELVETIFENVSLVPESAVVRRLDEAERARSPHPDADPDRPFGERDENDVVFLAAALAVGGDVWSDDGVFKHQEFVSWYRTGDVIECAEVGL